MTLLSNFALMFLCVATWTGSEYLRSVLLTGFPWNLLGICQYNKLVIAQIASWGGVYAVSATIVWVNAAVTMTLLRYIRRRRPRWHPELFAGLLILALVHMHGQRVLLRDTAPTETLRAALIQPNIPQQLKWTYEYVTGIYKSIRQWSLTAANFGDPDIIIWPETAVPEEVRVIPRAYDLVLDVVSRGVPLLAGSIDSEWHDDGTIDYYNSSFLFDTNAMILGGYDKQHLVILGEYMPFESVFPFLSSLSPIPDSITPGKKTAILSLKNNPAVFSVLICFEDTIASLARVAVRKGARLLINQTNDAWFDVSSGARQHMTHCVFRCIENRVPALRATNTGITCAIDHMGRLQDRLGTGPYPPLVAGFQTYEIAVAGKDMPLTFYTQYGDLFALAMLIIGGGFNLLLFLPTKFRK